MNSYLVLLSCVLRSFKGTNTLINLTLCIFYIVNCFILIFCIYSLSLSSVFAMNFYSRRLDNAEPSSPIPAWGQLLIVLFLCVSLYYGLRFLFFIAYYWQRKAEKRMEKALKLRSMVKDNFRNENGYSWDYVFVFKVTPNDEKLASTNMREFSLRSIVLRMAESGLQTKIFYNAQHNEVFCKIRAPLNRLLTQARETKYNLLCDPISLSNLLTVGNRNAPPERRWGPIAIRTDGIQTEIPPYEFIYATYRSEFSNDNKMLYAKYSNKSIFRGVDRIKLLQSIITSPVSRGGCGLNIYELQKSGCIEGFFPIHDIVELSKVECKWFVFWQWPSRTPIAEVHDYFGEKIGFLTAFVAHYTQWLIWPAFLGFFAWINVAAKDNNPDVVMAPIFAFAMAIWATLFLESWKRKETRLSMEWGVFGDTKVEEVRPEYVDNKYVTEIVSPINGKPELYFPRVEYVKRQVISTSVSLFFIVCVIATIVGMFVAGFLLAEDPRTTHWSSTISAVINAVIVIVAGAIYNRVVHFLNAYENHRTSEEFENALIIKIFVVQFINNFSSLFFIAFFQRFLANERNMHVRRCTNSCMKMLQQTLSALFMSKLATGAATSLVVPYVNQKLRERNQFADVDEEEIANLEREFISNEYDLVMGPFQTYADYSMQFAYTTMFICAYPLATSMALVNNYVMMRVNAWFFCHLSRRPMPASVSSIGSWFDILEVVSYASVLVSSGLVSFTGDLLQGYSWSLRIWLFIILSVSVVSVKFFVQMLYPRVDEDIKIQLKRNEYILSKLFDNYPDPDDSKLQEDILIMSKIKLDIRINDDDPC